MLFEGFGEITCIVKANGLGNHLHIFARSLHKIEGIFHADFVNVIGKRHIQFLSEQVA